jgi:outer membrane protein assembly factor BamB
MGLISSTAAVLIATAAATTSEDWPQFRGPDLDGLSKETEWVSEGQEDNLWEGMVGLGYSACVVVDGKLYTAGHDEEAGDDLVWCLDAETGEELWIHAFPSKLWNQLHGGGTLTTPTVFDGVVYALNREGNLFALDAETGEVHWERNLHEDHELTVPTWGFSGSPLVTKDELLLNVGRVLSLDPKTGKTRWASKDYGHSYSSITPWERDGQKILAVFNSKGLAVLTPEDGSEQGFQKWESKYDINAATPVIMDGQLFISSGMGRGCGLFDFVDGALTEVWANKTMSVKMSSVVLAKGHLFGFDERVLKCLTPTGKATWSERGIGNGAVLGTPERLIMVTGKGELAVFAANTESYEELSKVKLFEGEGEVYWTHPTLVNGLIYARSSLGHIVCRDHRQTK